jgi:hypothetical protein
MWQSDSEVLSDVNTDRRGSINVGTVTKRCLYGGRVRGLSIKLKSDGKMGK